MAFVLALTLKGKGTKCAIINDREQIEPTVNLVLFAAGALDEDRTRGERFANHMNVGGAHRVESITDAGHVISIERVRS